MEHNNLTIVSVYGHNDGSSAIFAIQKSMQELSGSRGLLLSIAKPDNLPENIEWKQIGFLDYMMYSTFVMHSLYAFIETDYCLMVQDDGWVLNGANFKPEYLRIRLHWRCLPRCYGRQRTTALGDLA
jgi:hypothetical protein